MRCRDARLEDAAAIASIHVAAWRAAYNDLMPPAYLAALDVDRARGRWEQWLRTACPVVVVEANAEVVGFCRYGPSRDSGAGPSMGEIVAVNLCPASWRQGLGRELLLVAISRLRAAGFTEADPVGLAWQRASAAVLRGSGLASRRRRADPDRAHGVAVATRCDIGFRWPSD